MKMWQKSQYKPDLEVQIFLSSFYIKAYIFKNIQFLAIETFGISLQFGIFDFKFHFLMKFCKSKKG